MLIEDKSTRIKLINRINCKKWWRTAFPDKQSIEARGEFYCSSFGEAEFYGRPLDAAFRVHIANPIVGSYLFVEHALIGDKLPTPKSEKETFSRDEILKQCAEDKGFDSIVVLSEIGHKNYFTHNKLPRNMELNIFGNHCRLNNHTAPRNQFCAR